MPYHPTVETTSGAAAAVQMQDHLAATFGARVHVHPNPGLSLRATRQVVGAATIDTLSVTGFTATVESADAFVIATCVNGVVTRSYRGSADVLGPGQSVVIAQPGRPRGQSIRCEQADVILASFDIRLLKDIAAAAPDFDGAAPCFMQSRPAPAAERAWRQTLTHLSRELLVWSPADGGSTLVRAETSRLLAALALETFPNNAIPSRRPSGAPRRATALDRARAFVEDHADLDIGVSDIAGAACVTERALQVAFRRHLDTTPLRYLRTVRLSRVHEMLTAARPEEGVTVTDAAARWGFYNTGRFTTYYREAYGVLPSETLRGTARRCPDVSGAVGWVRDEGSGPMMKESHR